MHALVRAIGDACLGAGTAEELARDLRGFLERRGVAPDDVEAILAAPPRLAVYRSLVRNGLSGIVLRVLPRTRARMNAACGGRFDADFAAFVAAVGPRTHYLRDVPAELVAWAGPRWRADPAVPGYLADLADHELAQFAVATAEDRSDADATDGARAEIALDRPLAFHPSARLVRSAWAVHELPAGEEDASEPSPRAVALFVYRDASHAARWLEVTPLAAEILERLLSGEALGRAVQAACEAHAASPAPALDDVARLLADLGERGALIGARG
ncbi:MAG TPA: putative DNA-binding domain-containing protein [Polyangiaceae bacterium]|jgi:hypothetical protein